MDTLYLFAIIIVLLTYTYKQRQNLIICGKIISEEQEEKQKYILEKQSLIDDKQLLMKDKTLMAISLREFERKNISTDLYIENLKSNLKAYKAKYSKVINVEEEIENVLNRKNTIIQELQNIKEAYVAKKAIYDDLVEQVAIYDDSIKLAEFGFYMPFYDFDTSEDFQESINQIKEKQKQLIKSHEAIFCNVTFTVNESLSEGQTVIPPFLEGLRSRMV